MMNRCLSLLVSVLAPASAAVMVFNGTHPTGAVTLSERAPCVGLALFALAMAILHMRLRPTRSTRVEATMWLGLGFFFLVATYASPHLGPLGIVAALLLGATSMTRLVAGHGHAEALSQSPFRRRIFA